MGKRLENKIAVITGAGSGMGKAMAEIFSAEGARLVLADISGNQDAVAAAVNAAHGGTGNEPIAVGVLTGEMDVDLLPEVLDLAPEGLGCQHRRARRVVRDREQVEALVGGKCAPHLEGGPGPLDALAVFDAVAGVEDHVLAFLPVSRRGHLVVGGEGRLAHVVVHGRVRAG